MNSFATYLAKLRTWGLKGAFNFFIDKIHDHQLRSFLTDNARKHPISPVRGITLVAQFGARFSLSKTMRDLAFSLKAAGIPFQTLDIGRRPEVPDEELAGILTPRSEFRTLKYTHVIEMFGSPFPDMPQINRGTIVFWEFESGLLEFRPSLASARKLIAMSDFNLEVFEKLLPSTADFGKILYPFRFEPGLLTPSVGIRKRLHLDAEDFLVFFNFDYNSSFSRKNPDGAIRAFARALAGKPNAKLVFKTMHVQEHPKEATTLHALADQLNVGSQFVTVDDYLSTQDLYSLTSACDVYLSLHRGEGFGLGIAEAMFLGKPVVVSNYSATTEFCKPDCSLPIPCKMAPPRPAQLDHPCYLAVKKWAEPDIDVAARALRRLYDESELRTRLGTRAAQFIREHFSLDSFKASVDAYLDGVPPVSPTCQP